LIQINARRGLSLYGRAMVTYEVTFIGRPQGYQVTVNSPELKQAELVGDFSSLEAAEAFADNMRKIDAAPVHS
jgi:hypothetical protein